MSGSNLAFGVIETRSYAAAIEAADAMVKAAKVTIAGLIPTGGGFVSILIRGDVASVKAAVESGTESAEKVGQVVASHVIPRLHEDVESSILNAPFNSKDSVE